jgi:hypothetical protein
MALLNPKDDDFCPCGIAKKYKRCHGDASVGMPALQDNPDVDPVLLALAYNILDLLQDAIESISVPEINDANAEEVFRKRTLLYFAKKVHRATLAGVTLLRLGQSTQAFTLKRDQYHAWVAFFHYFHNDADSVLFMAAGPLRQRDGSKAIMAFDEAAKNDPKRQAQLKEHEANAERLYQRFPGLKVPKGKSGDTKNPILIDWSEPSEFEMMKSVASTWPDELRQRGETIDTKTDEEWIERESRKAHFFHSGFPSFDMHGNPMGLVGDLNDDDEDGATDLRVNSHEPNGLLCIYLFYPMNVADKLTELSGASGFKDRLTKLSNALVLFKNYFDAER